MKNETIKIYGKVTVKKEIPSSAEEYDAIATVKCIDRANATATATFRARVLKAAASAVEETSGVEINEGESPTAYFDRLTTAKKGESPLVSADEVNKVITDEAEGLAFEDVLVAERSSGGSIPSCSEGVRARLQASIDDGSFERKIQALDKLVENSEATAAILGVSFSVPEKAKKILEEADYTDTKFLDAFVYVSGLVANFNRLATGTEVKRSKK